MAPLALVEIHVLLVAVGVFVQASDPAVIEGEAAGEFVLHDFNLTRWRFVVDRHFSLENLAALFRGFDAFRCRLEVLNVIFGNQPERLPALYARRAEHHLCRRG